MWCAADGRRVVELNLTLMGRISPSTPFGRPKVTAACPHRVVAFQPRQESGNIDQ